MASEGDQSGTIDVGGVTRCTRLLCCEETAFGPARGIRPGQARLDKARPAVARAAQVEPLNACWIPLLMAGEVDEWRHPWPLASWLTQC